MENTMYFGGMLMLIGMTTVFTILALVVLGGKATIMITNRFFTDELEPVIESVGGATEEKARLAAITAAVQAVSHGRARIEKIEKLN